MKPVFWLAAAAVLLGSEVWSAPSSPAPLVGFSYSPLVSESVDRDPASDLAILLNETEPDLVRLPVYWESVEPDLASMDFSSIDRLLDVVESHNQTALRPTKVVLTVGARNFLFPELHEPDWAGPRQQPELGQVQSDAPYRLYFDDTLLRYRSSPLLYAWQVENEPFDEVGNSLTGDDQISPEQLAWEVAEVHHIDPAHDVVITTYDGWNVLVDVVQAHTPTLLGLLDAGPSGHPKEALASADALGLDIYVEGPPVPMAFTPVDLRSAWKQDAIDYWARQAKAKHKAVWLAEMQAQPWGDTTGFTPSNLVASAIDYRAEPLQVVLLWGVETWLQDQVWMNAAAHAMTILRT